jgi:chemotaxis protein MotB
VKKKKHDGEHDSSERWLLTYADLITLLLGLFVILYAMSKIDAGKYAEIVAALGGVFGEGKTGMMQGNNGVLAPPVNAMKAERARLADEIHSAMKTAVDEGLVSISTDEHGVTIHLMEELLFTSGSADLKESSLRTLDSLSVVLKRLPNDIRVEGHTDNVPINTAMFPSNWHLSVTRALNTAFYLIQKHDLPPARVSVVGYAEYRPLVPNTSDENRSRNRRVDIVVLSTADDVPVAVSSSEEQAPDSTADTTAVTQPQEEHSK